MLVACLFVLVVKVNHLVCKANRIRLSESQLMISCAIERRGGTKELKVSLPETSSMSPKLILLFLY